MKYLFLLVSLFSLPLFAQVQLNFNKRFVECEDQWVAFAMDQDSSYIFGFIYIDAAAGLTLNHEGQFKFLPNNQVNVEKNVESSVKVRLEPNNVQVALIPPSMFNALQIESTPQWLSFYKTDTATVKRNYDWGFMYNGWGECAKALTFLKKAQHIDPQYKGLAVEMAYSYNCLQQFDNAEKILEQEIKSNPTDPYVNKEYIYTLAKNKKIEAACAQFHLSSKTITDRQYNAENCYNILQYYYSVLDKSNFKKWHKELKKWNTNNETMRKYADLMQDDLKNK